MLRCYRNNNIDTKTCSKRIKAFEIPDYPALKVHLKQKFPQYFGGLILDFSANVLREHITQCIKDTFEFFESANVARGTRAALIGITVERYSKDIIKLGLDTVAKPRKNMHGIGIRVYEAFDNGYTQDQVIRMFGLKAVAVRRYYNVFKKQGQSINKSDKNYINLFHTWKNQKQGDQNEN